MPDGTAERIIGFIDLLAADHVVGWVCDLSQPSKPVAFRVVIDEKYSQSISADIYRGDVLEAGYGCTNVGFHCSIPPRFQDGQPHVVEFFLEAGRPLLFSEPKTGIVSSRWQVARAPSRSTTQPSSASIIVHVDAVADGNVVGWAYDESALATPVVLHLYVDDSFAAEFCCDVTRQDVLNAGHPSASVGFSVAIPPAYCDDRTHTLEIRNPSGTRVQMADASGTGHPSRSFCFPSVIVFGQVDGLHDGALHGWAIRHDRRTDRKQGRLQILVTLLGQPIGQVLASQYRADVAESLGCDPDCGFAFVPPPDAVAGRTLELRFRVIPGGEELKNSPYLASFPELETYRKLQDLLAIADQVFTQLWALRAQIKALLPAEQFTLQTYDAWARIYFRNLAALRLPPLPPEHQKSPLVSIICPTYRPRMPDFVAAVESVMAQTYPHWELIVIDDASGSAELTACIRAFAERDERIRPLFLEQNSGISGATNAALATATGDYVAFFDHDDLMVERALELMVHAALRTGAKLLYCDEDKIDDDGVFSEVNLKPDWNYRLLLAQNYVCHILFVERAQLRQAGPLRPECDGAQDHDLILRLAEITPPEAIHHVPEILYHWRKTPFSTAASGKSKAYAVAAGVRAVADHLARKELRAEVESPLQITCYTIRWQVDTEPKVSIIIPYREHIEMTRACVDAIREVTEYRNYDIVLVDNWSTSDEALAFAEEMSRQDGIRVMRVPESFNYSRLNNLAAAETEGEFLLFLNNDVFIKQGEWLTQMVGEALADPRVGIVGAKLLYPNGRVQHGGVVLGVGGIADHAHRGLTADDPGYMARAICAQDLSAVTAACMLCRRQAFERAGRFDEVELKVAFNDVDLCLKVGAAGYRIVWTPGVVAEHRESLSRGSDTKPEHQARFFDENKVMEERWGGSLNIDKFYNCKFSIRSGIFLSLCSPGTEP
jgi:GT2 family glycosyltransferase